MKHKNNKRLANIKRNETWDHTNKTFQYKKVPTTKSPNQNVVFIEYDVLLDDYQELLSMSFKLILQNRLIRTLNIFNIVF